MGQPSEVFLRTVISKEVAEEFASLATDPAIWTTDVHSQIGMLQGLAIKQQPAIFAVPRSGSPYQVLPAGVPYRSNRVFVVHGHDNEAKESVARFIATIGLEPIILHEQPNQGRTIIEKFEQNADVGFAVVLLTPDDVGAAADSPKDLKPRARQNVIMELGYFIGRLTRRNVCALYKHGVEIPSDFEGVVYIALDSAGAWKRSLAQELVEAGFAINLNAVLKA